MKNTINFYYNLYPKDVFQKDNIFYFWILHNKYYFAPLKNDKDLVLKIYEKLLAENKKVNKIILNKENNIVTKYENDDYVLIMVDCLENEVVDIEDYFTVFLNLNPIDWGDVWEKKIDYLEYQVSERALGKNNILDSFSYYVGLAENAIEYYNLLNKENIVVSIQHKRLYSINYEINYYNPLNMIVDYSVRDIAEYIKFSFFEDDLNFNKVINYIDKMNLNSTMINLLFVRLLFPTYYFDNYEKYINEEIDEKILLLIMKKAESYEKMLKNFYNFYSNKYNLLRIDWFFL